MRLISRMPLARFWGTYPAAKGPLLAWIQEVEANTWLTPNQVQAHFASARGVHNSRFIFKIKGNDFRLVAAFLYPSHMVLVKFIGTHAEYDSINPDTVELP